MPDGRWNALESVYTSLGAATPSGLLLRHDPRTGATTALAAGLWFGNGVALSKGEDFVVVADSIQAKLIRWAGRLGSHFFQAVGQLSALSGRHPGPRAPRAPNSVDAG
jgi:sugar lactone lactonase YvrE